MKRFLTSPIGVVMLLSIPLIAFSIWVSLREPVDLSHLNGDPLVGRNRTIVAGGIERPRSDLQNVVLGRPQAVSRQERKIDFHSEQRMCPKVPRLEWGKNKQMDSVMEALTTNKFPERLSPFFDPKPFDRDSWRLDPKTYRSVSVTRSTGSAGMTNASHYVSTEEQNYLDISEPGRIYDVLEPSSEVPILTNTTSPFVQLIEGESAAFSVKTLPFAPASFTAFFVGKFDNGLTAITTVADEEGIATAVFTGTNGHNQFDIVCGSPLASGTVRFQVEVILASPSAFEDPAISP